MALQSDGGGVAVEDDVDGVDVAMAVDGGGDDDGDVVEHVSSDFMKAENRSRITFVETCSFERSRSELMNAVASLRASSSDADFPARSLWYNIRANAI